MLDELVKCLVYVTVSEPSFAIAAAIFVFAAWTASRALVVTNARTTMTMIKFATGVTDSLLTLLGVVAAMSKALPKNPMTLAG